MAKHNLYGLSRYVPAEIRLQLRQEAGFGCVVCGLAIAQYEHIEPEFSTAQVHNPNRMAYLCGGCHDRVTRGVWSKEKVWAAKANPYCLKNNGCHDAFDIGDANVNLLIGSNEMVGVDHILTVNEEHLLTILPPAEVHQPYRLSGKFFDSTGELLFVIDDNEWTGRLELWDIECAGQRITVRTGKNSVALQILCTPGRGLAIERLDMAIAGVRFLISNGVLIWENASRRFELENHSFNGRGGRGAGAFVFSGDSVTIGRGGDQGLRIGSREGTSGSMLFSGGRHK